MAMAEKFYLTTAIPFVNAEPHLGFALEIVQADVIARFQRLLNKDVFFLTGSDENSLKNVQAAEEQNISTKELVNKNAKKFKDLKEVLNLTFDDFIKTTEKRHIEGAQKLWLSCKKEDIYKKKYKGLYCVGCESFYTEKDLVDGKCPEHDTKPEIVEEENYFFKLSKYQDFLKDLISKDKIKITPKTRKNEVLAFIERGLEDFSISRSKKRAHNWGISVPNDPEQIIYVWFDALSNYITALDWQNNGPLFKKYWPADIHFIGKGISRFHAIYWPAMLESASLSLPKEIFIHGYITINGKKISKSLGNVIDPKKLTEKYGIDAVRYYLLREIPAYSDGDFSIQRFKEVYNADLANGLGNLIARVAKLCERSSFEFKESKTELSEEYKKDLNSFKFDSVIKNIWEKIRSLDRYLDKKAPWKIKEEKQLKDVLQESIDNIRQIAYELQPFLPDTSLKIEKQFKGPKIKAEKSLFPRID